MASADPENRINLFRLQILIIDGGLLVLRSILDQIITAQGITLRSCLNNERLTIRGLHRSGILTQVQYDLLFPVNGQGPTMADMDITLIICLLTNLRCFGLNRVFTRNVTPVSTDITLEADLYRLRNFRNKICNMPTTTGIYQNDFARLWNEIEQILIRQSTQGLNIHQEIADFKSCPLDPEEERRINEEIKKWKDYEADVDRLKQEMGDVKQNVTEMQTKLDDVNENLTKVKNDLDDVKENETEVRRDFRDVNKKVTKLQIGIDDVKGNVMKVQKDLEEVKRPQQTDRGSGEDFPIQTEEEKYQNSKKEFPGIGFCMDDNLKQNEQHNNEKNKTMELPSSERCDVTRGHEHYLSHILLLEQASPIALKAILKREEKKSGKDLSIVSNENRDSFKTQYETEYLQLFQEDNFNDDIDTWDTLQLCAVILVLYKSGLTGPEVKAIQCIYDQRKGIEHYAECASLTFKIFIEKQHLLHEQLLDLTKRIDVQANLDCRRIVFSSEPRLKLSKTQIDKLTQTNDIKTHHKIAIDEHVVTENIIGEENDQKLQTNEDSVPDEVASDPRTRELYQKALEKGTEKDNTIRVMVIGCFEQGKTSLVRNLLKQSIDGVETTNGIELHKCTVISDEEWKKLDNEDLNKETIKRLVNIALKEKNDETTSVVSKEEKCLPSEDTLISSSTTDILRTRNESVSFPKSGIEDNAKSDEYEGKRKEGIQVSKFQIAVAAKSIVRNEKVSYENLTSFHTELEISESIQGKINLENNVTLNIWDFGGQFVFYATHQIFHSQQAVYLLVFNLSISLDTVIEDKEFPLHKKTMRDYLKFWVASVNSFVGSSDGMKPAIVLVGTHRDKLDAGNNSEDYFEQVRQLFDHSICINHIQPEHFAIANTSGSESEINALRTYISRLGQRQLEKIMPAKWILLEKALKINKQKKIITIDKLKQIDSETDSPLQTDNSTETMDQIKLFLSYHHAKGTFCYFDEDNLSNHVVLDPQFLVDAFRCVITSEKFCIVRPKLRHVWKELCNTAILRPELFDEVWKQDKDNNFYEFKHLLIEYMQKHNILAEALAYNLDSEPAVRPLGYFIVPSLLKASSLSADTIRSYLEGKQLSTVSLCYRFENETLTHFIFQACLAGIIGRWPLAKYIKTHVLFDHVAACDIEPRHAGVLMLSENKLELLVVSLCPPDNVKADVCDMFRRYVEVVMMKRMHKLPTDKHEGHFVSREARCLHKDHGTKGSYGSFDIDAINNIQSWNDEKIPCPDRNSHCLQMRSIVKEWFMPNIDQNKVPKRKLSKKEYSTLAMSIGNGWKLIGLQLGLDNIILDHICMNENDACTRIYNMFLKWDNKEGDQATLDVIVQAIEKCNPEHIHVKLDVLKNIINGF